MHMGMHGLSPPPPPRSSPRPAGFPPCSGQLQPTSKRLAASLLLALVTNSKPNASLFSSQGNLKSYLLDMVTAALTSCGDFAMQVS
jgi:hypothetical protein